MRAVEKSDIGFGQWVKQHTIRQGIWQVQTGKDDLALLKESARQLKIGNPDVRIAKDTSTADAGVLAAGALALPKLAQQLPKAAVLAGEAAPPLLIASVGVLGAEAIVDKHVEVSKSNWEDAEKAKVMPLPMNMDDAEPLPQPSSEVKPKAQPFAEPAAKPKVQDLPNAPTDLVPVPHTKPETMTAQPEAPPINIAKSRSRLANLSTSVFNLSFPAQSFSGQIREP